MRVYRGYRLLTLDLSGEPLCSECRVFVFDKGKRHELPLRLDIRNHSPTGFEWGYGGSGPAQLALALVADALGDMYAIPSVYQHVKRKLVAGFSRDGWMVTAELVQQVAYETAIDAELADQDGEDPPTPPAARS